MSNDTLVTVTGYTTYEPELKQVGGNIPLVNLTIASTPQKFDKASNTWVDGETMFMKATAWRALAENIALNIRKGTLVIAQGKLVAKSYENKEGVKVTNFELELVELGQALSRPVKSVEVKPETADAPF